MSLFLGTVWATVSKSTVEATPIYQTMLKNHNGYIPKGLYNSTIKAALMMLGMPEKGDYTVERNVNIRSNTNKCVVFANTTLYTFPVDPKYAYKSIYQNNDIVHFGEEGFAGWGVSHIKMEDFGNEHDPSRDDGSDF